MKRYYVTAIVDTRRSKDWVLHGRQNRSGKFCGRSPKIAHDRAIAYWGKTLAGNESVTVTSVRSIKA